MRIKLEMAANTRDLGDLQLHGVHIKQKKLLRSGKLFYTTQNDIRLLENEYQLKRIIDFRNNHEIKHTPDPYFENVHNVHIPILDEHYLNISSTKEKNIHAPDVDYLKATIEEMNFDVESVITQEYIRLISSPYCQHQYKSFLDELLIEVHGATLYHCSAGKDRVGVGTLILGGALGLSKEDIIQDYMETNDHLQGRIDRYTTLCKESGWDELSLSQIPYLTGVSSNYINAVFDWIDEHYGSLNTYLSEALDFDTTKQANLRKIYCE